MAKSGSVLPSHFFESPPKYGKFALVDVLSQIGECLQSIGYEKTLNALYKESASKNVKIDVNLWKDLATDKRSEGITTLADMWSTAFGNRDIPQPYLDNEVDDLDSDNMAVSETVPETSRHTKPKDKISDEASGSSSGSDMMERAAPKGKREETPLASESELSDSDSDAEAGAKQDDSSNLDSSSDSGSGSEASDSSAKAGQKRKRVMTPDSSEDSSSDSDSGSEDSDKDDTKMASGSESKSDSSSSDSEDSRPAKRTKFSKDDESSDSSSSDSDSSSSSGSSGSQEKAVKKSKKPSSESSSSDSDSDSSSNASNKSGSSSDSSSNNSSNSSSGSSSDSESGSSPSPSPKKKVKKEKKQPKTIKTFQVPKIERTGSATSSSATLEAASPVRPKDEKPSDTLIVHDADAGTKALPATKENVKKLKKEQVPFSRIPTDTRVDPKFASNAYVPYDYANRAYQDLSVTKGKGFTKEKNKKKRGAYRGGAIDLAPKAIKFED